MKHKKLNMAIIFIMTGVVLWYLLKDHYREIVDSVLTANVFWLITALLLCFIYLVFDVLTMHNLTRLYTKDLSFGFQMYLGIIGRFFSGITPLATGSQPMQVYEMHKKGVSITNGTNIAVQAYMIFQVALMLVGTIAIILNKVFGLFANIPFLNQMTIIGFIINFGILLVLILVSFSKGFNKTIIGAIIRFLGKIRIIKKPDETIKKWNKTCEEYYNNARVLLNNKNVMFRCIFFEVCALLFYYTIPLMVAYALGIKELTWYATIAASSYVFITGCYVPIPGATGGMEYGFSGLFGNFVVGYKLNALLVLWRFITYYLPVIIGGIIFNLRDRLLKQKEK